MKKVLVTPEMIFGFDLGVRVGRNDVIEAFKEWALEHVSKDAPDTRLRAAITQEFGGEERPIPVLEAASIVRGEFGLPKDGEARTHAWITQNITPGAVFTARILGPVLGVRSWDEARHRRVNSWIRHHADVQALYSKSGPPKKLKGQSLFQRKSDVVILGDQS